MGQNEEQEKIRVLATWTRFIKLGYKPIALGKNEVIERLDMPENSSSADMVLINPRGICAVIECKGRSSIESAIKQLTVTVDHASRKFGVVEPQLIVNALQPTPHKSVPTVVLGYGWKAKYLQYVDSYILLLQNGTEAQLGTGHKVMVGFDYQP